MCQDLLELLNVFLKLVSFSEKEQMMFTQPSE